MKFGNFDLSIVRECEFKLDGGAMFGVVPKPLWEKVAPPDNANRVALTCNLLLIDTGKHKVLVETGMGSRWTEKEIERYGLTPLVDDKEPLASIGVRSDQIDAVIISHLHFDHAGGATCIREGELVPTFPNARYYFQKGEWEFAHKANARAKASYRADDFEPIYAAGQAFLMDGDGEVVPGIHVHRTGGHTTHHQIVSFESEGQKGSFFADIIPTKCHIPPPWVMGYDHFPLDSCDVKSEWLTKASAERWLIVFDHEPGVPWGYVNGTNGKFEFEALPEETLKQTVLIKK